jgi:hypothetical protein
MDDVKAKQAEWDRQNALGAVGKVVRHLARETTVTTQPREKHTGTVSEYPDPDGDGWRFVRLQYDDERCYYHWERFVR